MTRMQKLNAQGRWLVGAALLGASVLTGVGVRVDRAREQSLARAIDSAYAPRRAERPAAESVALLILARRCGLGHMDRDAPPELLQACLNGAAQAPLPARGPFDSPESRRYDELREIWLRATLQRLEATKSRPTWPVAANDAA